jgi:hypothetical protein
VQTCALLAMVVPEELGISKARCEQFVESYIGMSLREVDLCTNACPLDLLSRLELHVVAAYVRKHAPVQWIRRETAINCSMSTQCVRCRKPINNHGSSSSATMKPPGALAYCQNCRAPAVLCSIWSAGILSFALSSGLIFVKVTFPFANYSCSVTAAAMVATKCVIAASTRSTP